MEGCNDDLESQGNFSPTHTYNIQTQVFNKVVNPRQTVPLIQHTYSPSYYCNGYSQHSMAPVLYAPTPYALSGAPCVLESPCLSFPVTPASTLASDGSSSGVSSQPQAFTFEVRHDPAVAQMGANINMSTSTSTTSTSQWSSNGGQPIPQPQRPPHQDHRSHSWRRGPPERQGRWQHSRNRPGPNTEDHGVITTKDERLRLMKRIVKDEIGSGSICWHWTRRGYCNYGDACQFRHPTQNGSQLFRA